jgi:hypothetical protein
MVPLLYLAHTLVVVTFQNHKALIVYTRQKFAIFGITESIVTTFLCNLVITLILLTRAQSFFSRSFTFFSQLLQHKEVYFQISQRMVRACIAAAGDVGGDRRPATYIQIDHTPIYCNTPTLC